MIRGGQHSGAALLGICLLVGLLTACASGPGEPPLPSAAPPTERAAPAAAQSAPVQPAQLAPPRPQALGAVALGEPAIPPPPTSRWLPDQSPRPNERWLEVDLGRQLVFLREGNKVLRSIVASTGVPEANTEVGSFRVYEMNPNFQYLARYGDYIINWVAFDGRWPIGFHSRPMDARGNVVDATLGKPASHGCVRTAESDVIFDFAELGMRVEVHD